MKHLHYTKHATLRMCQRNLSKRDVEFIVRHAKPAHRTGVRFFRLTEKDIPKDVKGNSPYRRLVGSTVLVCQCDWVITAYRNERAHKRDRRKARYDSRPFVCSCKHLSATDLDADYEQ